MHSLAELAKASVEEFVRRGSLTPLPGEPGPEMLERAGVFVCIKKNGELRGCIGTFLPCCENVAGEIIRNAVAAACQDPRFPPVTEEELVSLEYTVDVLSEPEKVNGLQDLDPRKYGVIVSSRGRRGLLLPDLEGVDTAEQQIGIASMKAGIGPGERPEIMRFGVRRYQ